MSPASTQLDSSSREAASGTANLGRKRHRPRLRGWRRIVFPMAAVLIGLSPFFIAEGFLRLGGWGRSTDVEDPYFGFSDVHPLFVPDESGERLVIPKSRQAHFCPESFAAEKGPREFRIFCLGGSTVQGRPYAIETSFTSWLELSLAASDPSRDWQVVNCGGVSYASYRLIPIMQETMQYQPDLYIIYTGHNEFLEDRTYREVKDSSTALLRTPPVVRDLRIYNVARSAYLQLSGNGDVPTEPRGLLPDEVDALLDYRGGLEDYHRDDAWREQVMEHFRFNLYRMVHLAREADVPIILVNPVSNLADCPPFKVERSPNLTDQQRVRFANLFSGAVSIKHTNCPKAIEMLEEALTIDSRNAAAHFVLGECYQSLGQYDKAKAAFVRAKDEDICPLRILEPMHEVIREVSRVTGTPLVDVRELFDALSRDNIPGGQWMVDHVHPNIEGHKQIAEALLDEMADLAMVAPGDGWKERRDVLYQEHFESLNPAYFARGMQRLEGLQKWTQGRSAKIREPSP